MDVPVRSAVWTVALVLTLGSYLGLAWTMGLTISGIDFDFALDWLAGHWHMTLDEPAKRRERDRFFKGPPSPQEQAQWLKNQGIRWIIYFPREWPGEIRAPASLPGVTPLYLSRSAILFRCDPP